MRPFLKLFSLIRSFEVPYLNLKLVNSNGRELHIACQNSKLMYVSLRLSKGAVLLQVERSYVFNLKLMSEIQELEVSESIQSNYADETKVPITSHFAENWPTSLQIPRLLVTGPARTALGLQGLRPDSNINGVTSASAIFIYNRHRLLVGALHSQVGHSSS